MEATSDTIEADQFIMDLNQPFLFKRKPKPLPADLRPKWRVLLLLLILSYSRGNRASFSKLHVINWVIRSSKTRKLFINYLHGDAFKNEIIVRVEPWINRAIDIAKAEGLVNIINGKSVKLTVKGEKYVIMIKDTTKCYNEEINFLDIIRPHVNENDIETFLSVKGL